MISIPSIDVALQINNTTRAVDDGSAAPAGRAVPARRGHDSDDADAAHDLRPEPSAATFVFEQVTGAGPDGRLNTSDDTKILKIAVSNLELTLGDAPTPASTSTNGSAKLLLTPDGHRRRDRRGRDASTSAPRSRRSASEVRVTINTLSGR